MKILTYFYKKVKSNDSFGHNVFLNFNKNGNVHNTFCGGIFSICIQCVVMFYIYVLLNKMVTYNGDNTKTIEMPKTESETSINLTSSKIHFKIMFMNVTNMEPLKIEEISKYVNLSLYHTDQQKGAKNPITTVHGFKPLKVDSFPVMILENGTSSPVVETCRSNDTHCYEFDHDETVMISRSTDGLSSRSLNFHVEYCKTN